MKTKQKQQKTELKQYSEATQTKQVRMSQC